jgi:glycine cleavage system aminomethyltransferase T
VTDAPTWWLASPGSTSRVGDAEVVLAFDSPEAEYRALRSEAGHYDLTSCGRIQVKGTGASGFMQRWLTRDTQYLLPEACLTALALDSQGRIRDIPTVFVADDGSFELQTAIGCGSSSLERTRRLAGDDVEITLQKDQAAVAIEGPATWSILEGIGLEDLIDLPFQRVRSAALDGRKVRVARTGVTGEFGVEIIGARQTIDRLMTQLATLCPRVGMRALETAMLDVRQPNLWRECFGTGVGRAGLHWLVDFHKEGYEGRDAARHDVETAPRSRVGFVCSELSALAPGVPITTRDDVEVGELVWSTYSPGRQAVLGVAELDRAITTPGLRLQAGANGTAQPVIETKSCPMVVPGSWAAVALDRSSPGDEAVPSERFE